MRMGAPGAGPERVRAAEAAGEESVEARMAKKARAPRAARLPQPVFRHFSLAWVYVFFCQRLLEGVGRKRGVGIYFCSRIL